MAVDHRQVGRASRSVGACLVSEVMGVRQVCMYVARGTLDTLDRQLGRQAGRPLRLSVWSSRLAVCRPPAPSVGEPAGRCSLHLVGSPACMSSMMPPPQKEAAHASSRLGPTLLPACLVSSLRGRWLSVSIPALSMQRRPACLPASLPLSVCLYVCVCKRVRPLHGWWSS